MNYLPSKSPHSSSAAFSSRAGSGSGSGTSYVSYVRLHAGSEHTHTTKHTPQDRPHFSPPHSPLDPPASASAAALREAPTALSGRGSRRSTSTSRTVTSGIPGKSETGRGSGRPHTGNKPSRAALGSSNILLSPEGFYFPAKNESRPENRTEGEKSARGEGRGLPKLLFCVVVVLLFIIIYYLLLLLFSIFI